MSNPAEFFSNADERVAAYQVTDDVTDDAFEEAIDEGKAERNLSRANVVRKVPVEHQGRDAHSPRFRSTRDRAPFVLA